MGAAGRPPSRPTLDPRRHPNWIYPTHIGSHTIELVLDLAFRPDPQSPLPVYRQLGRYIERLIAVGRLEPGEKLPASRELSESLGVSRNTVNSAYRALAGEGLLAAGVGRGTFVSARAPRGEAPEGGPGRGGFVWDGLVSLRARELEPPVGLVPMRVPVRFNFGGGVIDLDTLPTREIRRALSRAVTQHLSEVANPGNPLGWQPLRDEIAGRLVSRGIECDARDVLITSGAQQALDLVARTLCDPDDAVVIEQPGYFGAERSFRLSRARLVGVGVDEQGLRIDELARVLRSRRVKLIYTTPSAQCPTGATLSLERRRALLDLADTHQTPVLEDDYESELRFEQPALPCLKALDPRDQVIYVGTFSKALYPGLRLGYVVAARPLLERLALVRFSADLGFDGVGQAALVELLRSEALDRHVRRIRRLYSARRDALLEALERFMPEGTHFTRPTGGLQVWVRLPPELGLDPEGLHADARSAGIVYGRGELFFADGGGRDHIALSFASQTPSSSSAGSQSWPTWCEGGSDDDRARPAGRGERGERALDARGADELVPRGARARAPPRPDYRALRARRGLCLPRLRSRARVGRAGAGPAPAARRTRNLVLRAARRAARLRYRARIPRPAPLARGHPGRVLARGPAGGRDLRTVPKPEASKGDAMRLEPIEKPRGLLTRFSYAFSKRQLGKVPSVLKVLYGRAPKLLFLGYQMNRAMETKLSLDRALVLLIQAQAAGLNGCGFCLDMARAHAFQKHLDLDKLDGLTEFSSHPAFDDRERAMLAYVEQATRQLHVDDAVFETLRKHFSEQEIVEITWVNAVENYYNRLAIPLGLEADGLCSLAQSRARSA